MPDPPFKAGVWHKVFCKMLIMNVLLFWGVPDVKTGTHRCDGCLSVAVLGDTYCRGKGKEKYNMRWHFLIQLCITMVGSLVVKM